MVVRVDEAGRQHEPAPVDGFFTRCRCHVADLRDPAVADPYAARPPRRAGAIHDGRIDDNERSDRLRVQRAIHRRAK